MIFKNRIFQQTYVMNNTTIINIFNSDNSNIAYIKTAHCRTIAYMILKFESMIKRKIMANHTFLTFGKINFAYINSIVTQRL